MQMGIYVIALIMSIVTIGEGTLANRDLPNEISTRRASYIEAYEEGVISEDLYEVIINFLDETEARLAIENSVDVYNAFPSNYVWLLTEYPESEMNVLGDSLLEAKDAETREDLKWQYNADMRYIEKELLIYGEKVCLQFSEEEFKEAFPVLQNENDTRQGGERT